MGEWCGIGASGDKSADRRPAAPAAAARGEKALRLPRPLAVLERLLRHLARERVLRPGRQVAERIASLATDRGERVGGMVSHPPRARSEEHTSELQSLRHLVCRLLLEKK